MLDNIKTYRSSGKQLQWEVISKIRTAHHYHLGTAYEQHSHMQYSQGEWIFL